MKIYNTGLGEKMELVTELKTRNDYMTFCLENGAVGGCAKNKTEVRQANKARLIEMTKWICDNYMTYLEYSKESANMTRNDMINEMAGNDIDVSYDWLKSNDPLMLDTIYNSKYWEIGEEKQEIDKLWVRLHFSDTGVSYTATTADEVDVDYCLGEQPPWGEDELEDWTTGVIEKYYNEFKNQ